MSRLKDHRRCRGVALVYTAIACVVLLGLMGLAIDTGRVYLVGHELQSAADASALAGAQYVQSDTTQARSRARAVAAANHAEGVSIQIADNPANGSAGQIVIGTFDRNSHTFTPTLTSPNAVKITTYRSSAQNGSLPLLFGPIYGTSTSNVQRTAIAMTSQSVDAGVILLNLNAPGALSFNGTGNQPKIIVTLVDSSGNPTGDYGDVIVNSNNAAAFSWSGNPTITAQNLYLGSNQGNAQNVLTTGETLHTNQAPTADPLASQYSGTPPKPTTAAVKVNNVWRAGYYNSSFGGGTLGPGLHWFANGISGGVTATQGSLIYVDNGDISLGGNDVLKVRKITDPNSPYAQWTNLGIAIWIAKGNLTMKGTPDIDNNGILYLTGHAASGGGNVDIRGNPTSVGTSLISDTLSIEGTGQVNIRHPADPNASPGSVFLVQ